MAVGNGFEEGTAVIELSDQPKDTESPDEEAGLLKNTSESSAFLTISGAHENEEKSELPSSSAEPGTKCGPAVWATLAVLAVLVVSLAIALLFGNFMFGLFKQDPALRFFVVGDWGREGGENQSSVALLMANRADTSKPEFVISVGDNFYESGLISPDDEQFTSTFTDVYSHDSLQVPWHVVLGNHDYGEFYNETKDLKHCPSGSRDCYFSPLHQLNERLIERDPRWHCERWFQQSFLDGLVEIFFIDTNPFILRYHTEPWAINKGGILEQSWESQLLELEARLATSLAKWKLVVGHHPVRNNHMPENTPELIQHLEPVLEAQGVQAYFSGHEHNLQYLHVENATTHYVVSGAGSKTDYFPAQYWDNGGSIYQHQGSGFVDCELTLTTLDCEYLGIADEAPLYTVSIPQQHHR